MLDSTELRSMQEDDEGLMPDTVTVSAYTWSYTPEGRTRTLLASATVRGRFWERALQGQDGELPREGNRAVSRERFIVTVPGPQAAGSDLSALLVPGSSVDVLVAATGELHSLVLVGVGTRSQGATRRLLCKRLVK